MNRQTPEFDQRIADWLEVDPSVAPPDVMATVRAALPSIPQARRGLLAPWRLNPMNGSMRAATAAIAIVALAGVSVLAFNFRIFGSGTETARPVASASPATSDARLPAFTVAFSSPSFGYEARIPTGWAAATGTTAGSASEIAITEAEANPARFWDHFNPEKEGAVAADLVGTATVVPPGMSTDDWIEAYQAPQVAQSGRACVPERSAWDPITVDGREGSIYVGCVFVEVLIVVEDRVFIFGYLDYGAAAPELETTGRALLTSFVDTVTLHPERVTAPSITGWTSYTSEVYGFGMSYPSDWSVFHPASRRAVAGDRFPGDGELPYADAFSIGEDDGAIGVFVWDMPAQGADFETDEGLMQWAQGFCDEVLTASLCEEFTPAAAERMCLDVSGFGRPCGPALVVSTPDAQYAFFTGSQGWTYIGLGREVARVVVVAREEDFGPAARYGGSVALLKAFLGEMGVKPCSTDLLCDF